MTTAPSTDALDRALDAATAPRVSEPPLPPALSVSVPPALTASLRHLMHLRTLAIAGQAAAIAVAVALGVALPLLPMAAVVVGLIVVNLQARARLARPRPATHLEIAGHLAIDNVEFSLLLACAGGVTNPFGLLYFVHVALLGLLLPWRLAAGGVALLLVSAAAVTAIADPLRLNDGTAIPAGVFAAGFAAAFVATSVAIVWFVSRTAASLREHEHDLAQARQKAANYETMHRIGALAAGAAHELATPLSTMAVVVGELRRQPATPEVGRDADILQAQIDACRRTLSNLMASAGHARADAGGRERLDGFLESIVERCRRTRPGIALRASLEGVRPAPEILAEESLRQAILNLLNNAADASPHGVVVDAAWDDAALRLAVVDEGPGIPADILARLGRTFVTTKPPGHGTGLGLVLAAATIDRLGGRLTLSNRAEGGARADVLLPLRALTVSAR